MKITLLFLLVALVPFVTAQQHGFLPQHDLPGGLQGAHHQRGLQRGGPTKPGRPPSPHSPPLNPINVKGCKDWVNSRSATFYQSVSEAECRLVLNGRQTLNPVDSGSCNATKACGSYKVAGKYNTTATCSCAPGCENDFPAPCCFDYESTCKTCAESCGGQSPGLVCGCDVYCNIRRNCCPHFVDQCPDVFEQTTCKGKCGGTTEVCSCESNCAEGFRCCLDFLDYCESDPEFLSCEKYCGKYSTGLCGCFDICVVEGNCCDDYKDVCPAPDPNKVSCVGKCGGTATFCTCFETCADDRSCCPDYTDWCGE